MSELTLDDRQPIIDRLKQARRYRQGPIYHLGHREGVRWAANLAAWREVRYFAAYREDDIHVNGQSHSDYEPESLSFSGKFKAPDEDYRTYVPSDRDNSQVYGAPAFQMAGQDAAGLEWVTDRYKCETYWRGWLGGVLAVHALVEEEIERDDQPDRDRTFRGGEWVKHAEFGVGYVVSSSLVTVGHPATEEDLVIRFDHSGVKSLRAPTPALQQISEDQVELFRQELCAAESTGPSDVDPDDIPF